MKSVKKHFIAIFTKLINLAITNALLLFLLIVFAAILDCHVELIGYQIIQQF